VVYITAKHALVEIVHHQRKRTLGFRLDELEKVIRPGMVRR
jgi:hypothetical protein